MEPKAIILFTRVPQAGKTKTRLQPFLTGEECALLHQAFIKDIFNVIKSTGIDIIICYTPEKGIMHLRKITSVYPVYIGQRGVKLGDRMHNAISQVLNMGYSSCVLIGSDAPTITKTDIEKSFAILEHKDIALLPVEDGGYCLIGMKEPCKAVFSLEYGGEDVLEKTIASITKAGKTYGTGPVIFDVDTKEDLMKLTKMLMADPCVKCVHTREAIKHIFGDNDDKYRTNI